MAANDFLKDENVDNNSGRITALFPSKSDAYRAMTELKQAGFSHDQIGLAALDDNVSATQNPSGLQADQPAYSGQHESGEHRSFWQEVKDFFSGESHDDAADFDSSTSGLSWSTDRSAYYSQGLYKGGAIITVMGGDATEARRILEHCGGDLRETGFESTGRQEQISDHLPGSLPAAVSDTGTAASNIGSNFSESQRNVPDIGQRSIQLRGELLRAHKERVQRGEVRLRKEVVTENQTIEVPVTREELVIERGQPTHPSAPGEIGTDSEIRIPLSEERAVAEKQAVVNEEVRVGKRQITNTQRVSDDVRREELKVEDNLEKDGDSDIDRNKAA